MAAAAALVVVAAVGFAAARGVAVGSVPGGAPAGEAKEAVQVRQDGADVVVTKTVTVNNSRHALLTDAFRDPRTGGMRLTYVVVQNRDYLVRSQKRIEVTWRVAGGKGTDPVRVNGSVMHLGTVELKAFAGEVAGVMEGPVGEGR
jgi:hypothetical protein